MAGLSSMTSTRRLKMATGSPMSGLRRCQRQIERKDRALPTPSALDPQFATELAGSQRPAVQAESMPFPLRGEPVIEYTSQVLGSDPDAVVCHTDLHTEPARGHTHGHDLLRAIGLLAGVLGVANQVDQYLQHPVLVDDDGWRVLEFSAKDDSVTGQCALIQTQTVFHEARDIDDVRDAAEPRVVLLHRHNVLDVVDSLLQGCQL